MPFLPFLTLFVSTWSASSLAVIGQLRSPMDLNVATVPICLIAAMVGEDSLHERLRRRSSQCLYLTLQAQRTTGVLLAAL